MAYYSATVASSTGTVKKNKKKDLDLYLEKWSVLNSESESDMEEAISCYTEKHANGKDVFLHLYGYGAFWVKPLDKDGEIDEDSDLDAEDFLKGLTKFLEPDKEGRLIVVQEVGHEKCRFPLTASEYVLRENGKLEWNGFKHSEA